MTKPNEPTLTCSEVVERLPQDLEDYRIAPGGDGPHAANWEDKPHRLVYDLVARCHAAETLQRRRERRVQELERTLAKVLDESSPTGAPNRLTRDTYKAAQKLLQSDEWREQIRKGATHE